MNDDLVKRVRKLVDTEDMHPLSIFAETIRDAADAIETLTRERDSARVTMGEALRQADAAISENAALRALLREAGEALELLSGGQVLDDDSGSIEVFLDVGDIRRARAVLARIKEAVDD